VVAREMSCILPLQQVMLMLTLEAVERKLTGWLIGSGTTVSATFHTHKTNMLAQRPYMI